MVTRSTRTAKPAAAKTIVAEEAKVINDAEHTEAAHDVFGDEQMSLADKIKAYFRLAAENYGAPSTRAYVCGLIAGFFVQCGVGYALWSVMSTLGIVMLLVSGSMFLATVIGILGLLITLILSGVAGTYVHKYIASGAASRHFGMLKSSVIGVFGGKRDIAAC